VERDAGHPRVSIVGWRRSRGGGWSRERDGEEGEEGVWWETDAFALLRGAQTTIECFLCSACNEVPTIIM
jgi:hypothetical protein